MLRHSVIHEAIYHFCWWLFRNNTQISWHQDSSPGETCSKRLPTLIYKDFDFWQRSSLVLWPLLKFKRSVDFFLYFMLRREETNFSLSWPLGDVVLPQALSLNIAVSTNVYDRMLRKDLENKNPLYFSAAPCCLKNTCILSRVT